MSCCLPAARATRRENFADAGSWRGVESPCDRSGQRTGSSAAVYSLDVAAERGNSDYDIRHRFTLAVTYAIPGRKSFWQLLEGWQLNSIVILETGMPYTLYDFDDDISFTGEFNDRWNITGSPNNIHWSKTTSIPFVDPSTFITDGSGNVIGGNPQCISAAGPAAVNQLATYGCYVSGATALTPPANGTFGDSGRNIFRGPDFTNWDFSVSKNIKFGEHLALQLRAEFFNILNHPNFAGQIRLVIRPGSKSCAISLRFQFTFKSRTTTCPGNLLASLYLVSYAAKPVDDRVGTFKTTL